MCPPPQECECKISLPWSLFIAQLRSRCPVSLYAPPVIQFLALIFMLALGSLWAYEPSVYCQTGSRSAVRFVCAVRLNGSARVNSSRLKGRFFIVPVYAPTGCNSLKARDEFYRHLSRLFQSLLSTDVVAFAGYLNAQLGHLAEAQRHIGGPFFCRR